MELTVLLTFAATGVVAFYLLTCRYWPYAPCRRCGGNGKSRSPFGGTGYTRCRKCKGSGERLRTGRRVMNSMSSTARRAR